MSNELRPESRPALEAHVADFAGVATVGAAFQHNRHADLVADLKYLRDQYKAQISAELDTQIGQIGSLAAQPNYAQGDFELAA